jgi:branched-chain amino acid transport system substrate-binding protein
MIRSFSRRFAALAAVAALTLGLPALAQQKTVTIDVILSQTGAAASLGTDETLAFQAYEKLINRTGGIKGQPLHFEIADDQSSPTVAVQLATAILAKHPVAVIGATTAGPSQAIVPLFKNGPLLYAMTPLLQPEKGSNIFAAGAQSSYAMAAAVRYFRMRGLNKIAVLTTTDATGQDSLKSLEFALALPENRGVSVVDREVMSVSEITIASQVAHIKASGAQAILAYLSGAPFGTALRSLYDGGVDLPIATASGNMNPTLLERFKSFMPKSEIVIANASFANRSRPASDPLRAPIEEFDTELAAAGTKPTAAHALAWDPARIIVSALRKLGPNATAEQLRDYINGLHGFPGVAGMYDFRIGDQHGLDQTAEVVIRYDPASATGQKIVSQQGGAPLRGI